VNKGNKESVCSVLADGW